MISSPSSIRAGAAIAKAGAPTPLARAVIAPPMQRRLIITNALECLFRKDAAIVDSFLTNYDFKDQIRVTIPI
jgi:hypothetical protein